MSVVIQPAGSPASREHYIDTVESLVNISLYQDLIGSTFFDLKRVSKNGKTALWGVTPGTNDVNVSKYKKLYSNIEKYHDIQLKEIMAKVSYALWIYSCVKNLDL